MIIPPQICAIGISSVNKKPVVRTDENGNEIITSADILPLNIVFDHRALDFGEVKPFLVRLEEIFKDPSEILIY